MQARTIDVDQLNAGMIRSLFTLYDSYYLDTSFDQFKADLTSKNRIVLVSDDAGALVGFSTLVIHSMSVMGQPMRVVYSGDTIIDKACWGSQALAFEWLREIGKIKDQAPKIPLYWLLTSKGYRTYRYLETFGLTFTPDWRSGDICGLTRIRNDVASRLFGPAFDPASGVVSWPEPCGRLAPEMAYLSERERARPDVQFFLSRNPGYALGDELVCLCSLDETNMKPLTRRIFRQGANRCPAGTP